MPRKLIDLYDESMIELEAQEQLVAMQVADHPHITTQGRKQIRRRLIALAGFDEAAAVNPVSTAGAGSLGAIGIKVVREDG